MPIERRATSPSAAARPSSASPIGGRSFVSGSAKPELGSHGRFVVTLRARCVPAFALKSARRPWTGVARRGLRPVDGCSGVLLAARDVAVGFAVAAGVGLALAVVAGFAFAFAAAVFAVAAFAVVAFAFVAAVVLARVVPPAAGALVAVRFVAAALAVVGFALAAAVVFAAVARPVAGFFAAVVLAAAGLAAAGFFVAVAFAAAGLAVDDFERAELAAGFFVAAVADDALAGAPPPAGDARRVLRLVGRPAGRFARTSLLSGSAMRRFLHARTA